MSRCKRCGTWHDHPTQPSGKWRAGQLPHTRVRTWARTRLDPTRQLPLVPYGNGPHIKLKLRRLPDGPGAYVVADGAGRVVYVGIATMSLRQRWGGVNYGAISPRNCFMGGQSTNVRINFLIGQALAKGEALDLWVRETPNPKPIELEVFAALKPPWTLRV